MTYVDTENYDDDEEQLLHDIEDDVEYETDESAPDFDDTYLAEEYLDFDNQISWY